MAINTEGFGSIVRGVVDWGVGIKALSLDLVGLGLHTIVPGPPAGFLRLVGGTGLSFSYGTTIRCMTDAGVAASASIQQKVGAANFQRVKTASTFDTGSNPFFNACLAPGEDLAMDVLSFSGGGTRWLGTASYIDLPDTNVTTLRIDLTDGSLVDIIPTVPPGKVCIPFAEARELGIGGLADNRDSVAHTIRTHYTLNGLTWQLSTANIGGIFVSLAPPAIGPGGSAQVQMLEASPTTQAPRVYFSYKMLNL